MKGCQLAQVHDEKKPQVLKGDTVGALLSAHFQ
jgi:hypothetical protein